VEYCKSEHASLPTPAPVSDIEAAKAGEEGGVWYPTEQTL